MKSTYLVKNKKAYQYLPTAFFTIKSGANYSPYCRTSALASPSSIAAKATASRPYTCSRPGQAASLTVSARLFGEARSAAAAAAPRPAPAPRAVVHDLQMPASGRPRHLAGRYHFQLGCNDDKGKIISHPAAIYGYMKRALQCCF